MKYKKYPNNFLELVDPLSNFESSKVVILPVPYEKTTTFNKGTEKGPSSIIENSAAIMRYDEELNGNICNIGICTLENLEGSGNSESLIDSVFHKVKKILENKKFPIILGGEHSITQGCVKAVVEKHENLSVLQIDAHTDLADIWDNTKYSHACVGRRCFEITKSVVPVGIRSLEKEEVDFAKENNISIFYAKDIVENDDWFDDAIDCLKNNVYITLDLDGLDPSFMPSVGNPEPGGLKYYPTLRFLRQVCEKRNVVGFDVVELCPKENDASSDFTAAKIVYKLIGYVFHNNKNNINKKIFEN